MFVEYPFSMDEKKAEIKLSTVVHNIKPEKSMIYIERDESDFVAVVKMKSGKKVYEKQRWHIKKAEKGLNVRREWSKAYLIDVLCMAVLAIACIASIVFGIINADFRLEMILVGMVFVLALIFYIWKRIATPGISLKIFLVQIL